MHVCAMRIMQTGGSSDIRTYQIFVVPVRVCPSIYIYYQYINFKSGRVRGGGGVTNIKKKIKLLKNIQLRKHLICTCEITFILITYTYFLRIPYLYKLYKLYLGVFMNIILL